MSTNIALHSKRWKASSTFYRNVMGFTVNEQETHLEIQNGPILMYIQEKLDVNGIVMEYYVDDLEIARKYLEENGCSVIKWGGKGKDCYMLDPFGLKFNLWEEPQK